MRTLLAKSVRLSRYHVAIVIILVSLIVWVILRYALMLAASLERTVFYNNVQLIQRMLQLQQILAREDEGVCSVLDNSDLFQRATGGGLRLVPLEAGKDALASNWNYNPVEHVLVYHVRTRDYFRADPPQRIMLKFYCQQDKISMDVSPHEWCREMAFWGCKQW